MSDDQLRFVRCGLDIEHEPHPHPGGYCDGQVDVSPALADGDPVVKLFTISDAPKAHTWSSLTTAQAEELRELLDRFVTFHNATFAVTDSEIIPACWALHPGLAWELAAFHALWVHVFQSGLAPPAEVLAFYELRLPGFQARLRRWLGPNTMGCTPGTHREAWNPAAVKAANEATRTGMDPAQLEEGVEVALRGYVANPAHLSKE